jgi:hypothetical protein
MQRGDELRRTGERPLHSSAPDVGQTFRKIPVNDAPLCGRDFIVSGRSLRNDVDHATRNPELNLVPVFDASPRRTLDGTSNPVLSLTTTVIASA